MLRWFHPRLLSLVPRVFLPAFTLVFDSDPKALKDSLFCVFEMVSSFGETFREPNLKLFVKDVREGKKRPIEVRSWSTIQNVKEILQRKIQIPTSSIRLFFGPLLTSGQELPNHRTLHDVGIYRSGETILLDIKNSADRTAPPMHSSKSSVDIQISASMMESTPKALRSLVTQARRGLSLGFKPALVLDGSGGTYILHDPCKRNIAVFKPSDEEPYAANNPRGYLRQPKDSSMALRAGVTPGEACMREVAAYLLDKDGFSGVPQTTLVEARHPTFNTNGARLNVSQGGASVGSHSIAPLSPVKPPVANKAGSFQEFVNYECTIDDISPSMISAKEVHKIAILDIRIMNSDRNSANLLVRRRRNNALELVPIDHGFCLRSVCDVCWMDWCWLDWPQLKEVRICRCCVGCNDLTQSGSLFVTTTRVTSWVSMWNLKPACYAINSTSVQKLSTTFGRPLLFSRPGLPLVSASTKSPSSAAVTITWPKCRP